MATKIMIVMEIEISVKKKVEIKTIHVSAGVRYWEDSIINGQEDIDGKLMPMVKDGRWEPIIDIETGIIQDWPEGTTADIHYKICDDGNYILKTEEGETALEIDGYVPDIMCPEENGYGDYIIMKVDEKGQIAKWKIDIEDFHPSTDD